MKSWERVLENEKEKSLWKHVNSELMSNEEEGEEEDEVIVKISAWRGKILNELVEN